MKKAKICTNIAGFTLIEILVVLVLIGLILGLVSFFTARRIQSSNLDSCVQDMKTTLREARLKARMKAVPCLVVIDLGNRTYGIANQPLKQIPLKIDVKIVDYLSNEISQGKVSLVFDRTGSADDVTITLSSGRRYVSIRTDPVTGLRVVGQ
jgi:type II secretion system protein H